MPYLGNGISKFTTADDLTVNGDAEVTGTVNPSGDTASGDSAAVGFTSAEGLILTGQGSTSDITVKNDADATVFTVPTGTDDILFPDNAAILMGASGDLKMFHNGSHSQINDLSTGNLQLLSNGAGVDVLKTDGEVMAKFITDGAVELYHDNSKKLETTSDGVDITGDTAITGHASIGVDAINSARALTVAGATDGSSSSILVLYNSSLSSMFSVRDDGFVDINGPVDMSSTLQVDGVLSTSSGLNISSSSSGGFNALTISQANNTSGNESRIRFKRTTDAGSDREVAAIVADRVGGNDTDLVFETNTDGSDGATERVRIGHSGDVYIGKTSENMATAGTQFRSSGQALDITRDGGSGLNVNRLSNDGEVIGLFKDTTQFCSIGVINGNNPFMSNDADNSGFQLAGASIIAHYDGNQQDAAVDLGSSSVRWNKGYFSNFVYTTYLRGQNDTDTGIDVGNTGTADRLVFHTGGSERARFTTSQFMVGKTSSGLSNTGHEFATDGYVYHTRNGNIMWLNTTASSANAITFMQSASTVGSIVINSSSTTYNTSSDRRLKSNIEDAASASDKIDAIQVRQFDWNVDNSHQDYGLIAQELEPIAPLAVTGDADSDEMMAVDYSKLVPMLLKEIQELRSRVAALEE